MASRNAPSSLCDCAKVRVRGGLCRLCGKHTCSARRHRGRCRPPALSVYPTVPKPCARAHTLTHTHARDADTQSHERTHARARTDTHRTLTAIVGRAGGRAGHIAVVPSRAREVLWAPIGPAVRVGADAGRSGCAYGRSRACMRIRLHASLPFIHSYATAAVGASGRLRVGAALRTWAR